MSARFSGRRYISLESYKSNGEPKLTPVQFVGHGGLLYLRTYPGAGKVRRIQRNPMVRVAPCGRNGKQTGPWIEGTARVLEGGELHRALEVLDKQDGTVGSLLVNMLAWLRGHRLTTVISIRPESESSSSKTVP